MSRPPFRLPLIGLAAALLLAACDASPGGRAVARDAVPGGARDASRTPAANEAVVRRFWDAWNQRDWPALDSLVTRDFVHHSQGDDVGLAEFARASRDYVGAFPDWRVTPEDVVARGDRVAVRTAMHGTNSGPFMGGPATGRAVTGRAGYFYRLVNGRIAEQWEIGDTGEMMQQLQAPPPRTPSPAPARAGSSAPRRAPR